MRRLAAMVAVAGLLLAGCGEDRSPAEAALHETEGRLSEIRSGTLSMTMLASPAGAEPGTGVGFELEGAFAVAEAEGDLPVADLQYTRITDDERRTTRFVSTGDEAFAEVDGGVVRLDEAQVEDLRATDDADGAGLEGLRLSEWLADPRVASGGRLDGVAVDRITGKVDVVPALNDLLGLAVQLGASDDTAPLALEGEGAERVRRAVQGAEVEIVTGREDRLVRRIDLSIDLEPTAEDAIRDALGDLAGVRLALQLEVSDVNDPIDVDAPSVAGSD